MAVEQRAAADRGQPLPLGNGRPPFEFRNFKFEMRISF
jgi:hypothetical protein